MSKAITAEMTLADVEKSADMDRTRKIIAGFSEYFQTEIEGKVTTEEAEKVFEAINIVTSTRRQILNG